MANKPSSTLRLFCCFLSLSSIAAAQSLPPSSLSTQKTFTLEDSRRLAAINDARLLSAEQDKIIAEERVREAKYLFLPEFGLQASATKYEARYPFSLSSDFRNILLFPDSPATYGANTNYIYSGRGYMRMSLYEGQRTINTLRLTQAAQKQAISNFESVKMDLVFSVKEVFYRLLLAQARAETSRAHLRAVEKLAAGIRQNSWERIELELTLATAHSRNSEAEHNLDLSRLAFLKNLNLELDTPFKIVGSLESRPVDINIEKASLWALELRPELQSETYKAQMDALSVNLASARRIPTVFLGSDYELTDRRFPLRGNNWDATIGIRIPFSYDYWSQVKQRRAEQRQGQLKRAELQDRVRLEVRQSYENLQYWQKEWPLRESHYRRVQALFESADRRPNEALGKIRALSALLEMKFNYLSALTEHILAQARLERAVGREIQP